MTRKEEIEKIASAFAIDEVKDTCNPASKRGLLYAGFVSGAEWADQHPMTYDGKAMLYVNSRSHENGYKEAVNKMIELLDKRLDNYLIHWDDDEYCWTKEMFLEQLRKTMMEGRGDETVRKREESKA